MSLKNKDGTPYRLRGPNPVMRGQELWGDYKLHNFRFKGEVVADTTELRRHATDFQAVRDFVTEFDGTKPEPGVVEKRSPIEEQVREFYEQQPAGQPLERPVVVMPDPQEQEPEAKPIFHCLPAVVRQRRDDLYGETYSTIQYESPFTFEAYIVDQSDMILQFWTSGPATDKITKGSVIYPKIMEKRWWRVRSKAEQSGGWLFEAVPSEYQPSFSLPAPRSP